MTRTRKALGNLAAAALAAAATLTCAFASAGPPGAGQESVKQQIAAEVKKEMAPAADQAKTTTTTTEVQGAAVVQKRAAPGRPRAEAQVDLMRIGAAQIEAIKADAAPAANIEPAARQFAQQFRPMLLAELRFLSSTCDPTPAQRREIALEGGRALKRAARGLAGLQAGGVQPRARNDPFPVPRRIIRDAMEAAARARLSPGQLDRYEAELARREKDYREVVALNALVNLDRLLKLNARQRDQLRELLPSQWDILAPQTIENLAVYEAFYPTIPDKAIGPILNEDQRKIWAGARKLDFGTIRNFNFGNPTIQVADDSDDADLTAALAEEARP